MTYKIVLEAMCRSVVFGVVLSDLHPSIILAHRKLGLKGRCLFALSTLTRTEVYLELTVEDPLALVASLISSTQACRGTSTVLYFGSSKLWKLHIPT